jgi:lipopolysaccharide export system protein LptA
MRGFLVLSALAAASMPTVPAAAQALKAFNTNAPVDFSADRIEVQDRAGRVVVSGNAQVRQGGLALDATRMTIAYKGGVAGNPTIQRIDASGRVQVRSNSENASGDFALYDVSRRLITLLGNVTLNQGANVVRGGRLVIDLTSGRSTIDGSSVGRGVGGAIDGGVGGAAPGAGGRVSGRFSVPQRN